MKLSSPFLELFLSTHLSLRSAEGAGGRHPFCHSFVSLCFRACYHTFWYLCALSYSVCSFRLFFFLFFFYSFVPFNFSFSFFEQASSHRFFRRPFISCSFCHWYTHYTCMLIRWFALVWFWCARLVPLGSSLTCLRFDEDGFLALPPPRTPHRSCFFSGD